MVTNASARGHLEHARGFDLRICRRSISEKVPDDGKRLHEPANKARHSKRFRHSVEECSQPEQRWHPGALIDAALPDQLVDGGPKGDEICLRSRPRRREYNVDVGDQWLVPSTDEAVHGVRCDLGILTW